jgi:hypothetical protein
MPGSMRRREESRSSRGRIRRAALVPPADPSATRIGPDACLPTEAVLSSRFNAGFKLAWRGVVVTPGRRPYRTRKLRVRSLVPHFATARSGRDSAWKSDMKHLTAPYTGIHMWSGLRAALPQRARLDGHRSFTLLERPECEGRAFLT